MKLKVFTVRDNAAEAYLPPFYFNSKGQALRSFMDALGTKDHQFCQHPEDYALWELGEFDDANGKFDLLPAPVHVVNAIDVIKSAA